MPDADRWAGILRHASLCAILSLDFLVYTMRNDIFPEDLVLHPNKGRERPHSAQQRGERPYYVLAQINHLRVQENSTVEAGA